MSAAAPPAEPDAGDGLTEAEWGAVYRGHPTLKVAVERIVAARVREAEQRGAEKALRDVISAALQADWIGEPFTDWLIDRADATRSES